MTKSVSPLSGSYGAGSFEDLASVYISRSEDKSYVCSLCGKVSRDLYNAKDHLEAKHFPCESGYNCELCGKTYKSKGSLTSHMSLVHRNK